MLMAVVAMIHPGITALPIISGETVGIERVARSVVLAVRGRIILRAVSGIFDDGLRTRWTCERRCQQRCAKYPCANDCKFCHEWPLCHEWPRRVGFQLEEHRARAPVPPGALTPDQVRVHEAALHTPGRVGTYRDVPALRVAGTRVPSGAVCDGKRRRPGSRSCSSTPPRITLSITCCNVPISIARGAARFTIPSATPTARSAALSSTQMGR